MVEYFLNVKTVSTRQGGRKKLNQKHYEQFVSENRELEQKLTKRNEQYIFDLKKSLQAANLSVREQTIALHDILPQLVQGQKRAKCSSIIRNSFRTSRSYFE